MILTTSLAVASASASCICTLHPFPFKAKRLIADLKYYCLLLFSVFEKANFGRVMCSWKRRPRIKFYSKEDEWSQSRFNKLPRSGSFESNVPSWEKRFCYLVGSVPWWKVVQSRDFLSCHPIVMNWSDSAVEETFHRAKQQFWAQINELPCDMSLPDPNMYTDDVDWNSYIDPGLILDLDREYLATCTEDANEKFDESMAAQDSPSNDQNHVNPWESSNVHSAINLTDSGWGWKPGGTCVGDLSNLNNDANPWEQGYKNAHGAVKENRWGDCGNKAWTSILGGESCNMKQSTNWDNTDNSWKNNCLGIRSVEDKGWREFGSESRGWNHLQSRMHESGHLGCSYRQDSGASGGWRESSNNSQGNGKWKNYLKESHNREYKVDNGKWGSQNEGCRKREGSNQYSPRCKSSRYHGIVHQ